MTNTVDNQPTAVSLQLTDELLGYQGAQSPPTRKVLVSQFSPYYLSTGGGTVTGATTFSGGLVGTATNNNAGAGQIGEFLSNSVTFTPTTNGAVLDLAILVLTAGDWDVWGSVTLGATIGAQAISGWVTNASLSPPSPGSVLGYANLISAALIGSSTTIAIPARRFSLAATTNIILGGSVGFNSGTCTIAGQIAGRRMR